MKDLYAVLGVPTFADADAIKASYRALVRQFHPDHHPNQSEADRNRFLDIQAAYNTLNTPDKRSKYDKTLTHYQQHKQDKRRPVATSASKTPSPSATETVSQFFDGFVKRNFSSFVQNETPKASPPPPQPSVPQKIDTSVPITLEVTLTPAEATEGTVKQLDYDVVEPCRRCRAVGRKQGKRCSACDGTGKQSRHCSYPARIPAGVTTGSRIRLPGQGAKGLPGQPTGDAIISITVGPAPANESPKKPEDAPKQKAPETAGADPRLRISGKDVHLTLPLHLPLAVLGTDLPVPTLHGPVKMRIPPGTPHGKVLRLRGQGVRKKEGDPEAGDQFVTISLSIPSTLSAAERQLWEALAKLAPDYK